METRTLKKCLSEALGIGYTLEIFKPGPFPLTEEVIRHFYFHLWSLGRPDAQLAARSTADSLLRLWAPSYLPLMARKKLIKKLHRLHDLFRGVVDSLRRKRKNAEEKKELFLKELQTRFDVSAESALDIIEADKTLSRLTNIHPTFLELPVTQWASDSTFIELSGIVTSLQVVNDAAERAVKFGSDFTKVLTKSEKQRQNILQAVELSRRAFPHATRKCFNRVNATSSVIELMVSSGYDAR